MSKPYTLYPPLSLCVLNAGGKTVYKVYVAAVNGAGRGDWQQTLDTVTTQGLGTLARTPITHTYTHLEASEAMMLERLCVVLAAESADSGGDVGLAVGVTVAAALLLLAVIALILLLLLVCVRCVFIGYYTENIMHMMILLIED